MSHPAPTRREPRPAASSARHLALLSVILAPLWTLGCEANWGGADFAVESPEPTPSAGDTAAARETGPTLPPLPEGPLLYYVRTDSAGRALAAPAARIGPDGGLRELTLPDTIPAAWGRRFDSAFYGPGRELALHAASRRAGSLVLSGSRSPSSSCPPVAVGQAFVPPGAPVPGESVAIPGGVWAAEPGPGARAESGDRARLFAPILAERFLKERGVAQPFLASRADLAAVAFPGSDRPGLAATYLIRDTLAPTPPSADSAVSLFYLASYDSAQGYVPRWVRVHRYGLQGGKRAYAWVASADGPAGRVHFLRLFDERSVRLAALWPDTAGEPGEVGWTESGRCSALDLVERAAGEEGD